ncbi:hypothetical protein scyTo_0014791, partial [Scyliorhinus torazame]|nr:hypothetical protein [Scyliorhinus torazame]
CVSLWEEEASLSLKHSLGSFPAPCLQLPQSCSQLQGRGIVGPHFNTMGAEQSTYDNKQPECHVLDFLVLVSVTGRYCLCLCS